MLSTWIEKVWEASCTSSVHCNDKEFAKYACPALHNLTVSSTGFSEEKIEIERLVVGNGGKYSAEFRLKTTDILICKRYSFDRLLWLNNYAPVFSNQSSKKLEAAKKNQTIKCVSYEWLKDSVKNGYAMPHDSYHIKVATSTPVKEDNANPDFSLLSNITVASAACSNTIDETAPIVEKSSLKRKRMYFLTNYTMF